MKTCTKCKIEQDVDQFCKHKSRKDGLRDWCQTCVRKYEDSVSGKLAKLKYLKSEKGQIARRKVNKKAGWKTRGIPITPEIFAKMLLDQNNLCYICGRGPSSPIKSLGADHDHKTGKLRKLLCDRCNLALGLVGDSEKLLSTMIIYLKEHGGDKTE